MQTAEDRRRLLSRLDAGPVSALAAVLKCLAGLGILLLVVTGPWPVLEGDHEAEAIGNRYTVLQLATVMPRTVAGAKRAFDERRQRFETIQATLQRM